MKNEKVLNDYLSYKRTSVKTENKIKDIKRYIELLLNSFPKSLQAVKEKDLVDFLNEMSKKYETGGLNGLKAYIKNFIKWHYEDWSSRFRNLDKLCRSEKADRTYNPKDMLSKEEVEKIVQGEPILKWKAYFMVLFYGGFRPGEVCSLKWSQIDFNKDDGAYISIFSQKNKEHFNKFIPSHVAKYLKLIQTNDSEWVFPSSKKHRKDQPIKEKAGYVRLVKLSQKVLGKPVNPYCLRHSIATILYDDDDINDEDVANHMGHTKNMKKTYSNLSESRLKERAKKVWIKAEDLPEKKKHELETRIEKLEGFIKTLVFEPREEDTPEIKSTLKRIKAHSS